LTNNSIIDHFDKYFEMVPAISEELKIEAYKLRYQVYCIENEFINSERYNNQLETDEYDQQSIHYLIRHRKSGDYAATTRLILPYANNPEKLFPLEQLCEIDNFAVMQTINRKYLGEVSRFCVSKTFKRRANEVYTLAGIGSDSADYFTSDERRVFPYFTLALIACVIKASHENDIHYLYATLEPAWLRFLSSLGINFIKIGPLAPGNYYGERSPAVVKITDMLDSVAKKKPDIWNLLTNKGSLGQPKSHEAIQYVQSCSCL